MFYKVCIDSKIPTTCQVKIKIKILIQLVYFSWLMILEEKNTSFILQFYEKVRRKNCEASLLIFIVLDQCTK